MAERVETRNYKFFQKQKGSSVTPTAEISEPTTEFEPSTPPAVLEQPPVQVADGDHEATVTHVVAGNVEAQLGMFTSCNVEFPASNYPTTYVSGPRDDGDQIADDDDDAHHNTKCSSKCKGVFIIHRGWILWKNIVLQ